MGEVVAILVQRRASLRHDDLELVNVSRLGCARHVLARRGHVAPAQEALETSIQLQNPLHLGAARKLLELLSNELLPTPEPVLALLRQNRVIGNRS